MDQLTQGTRPTALAIAEPVQRQRLITNEARVAGTAAGLTPPVHALPHGATPVNPVRSSTPPKLVKHISYPLTVTTATEALVAVVMVDVTEDAAVTERDAEAVAEVSQREWNRPHPLYQLIRPRRVPSRRKSTVRSPSLSAQRLLVPHVKHSTTTMDTDVPNNPRRVQHHRGLRRKPYASTCSATNTFTTTLS